MFQPQAAVNAAIAAGVTGAAAQPQGWSPQAIEDGGWLLLAGTSISAPLIAGIYGLAGNAAQLEPGAVYQHPGRLFDITAGNNALSGTPKTACGGDYLCTAQRGYDAPTGLGTPDGTGAF
jgi:hypothetical protein